MVNLQSNSQEMFDCIQRWKKNLRSNNLGGIDNTASSGGAIRGSSGSAVTTSDSSSVADDRSRSRAGNGCSSGSAVTTSDSSSVADNSRDGRVLGNDGTDKGERGNSGVSHICGRVVI